MEEALSPWIEVSDSLLRTHVDLRKKFSMRRPLEQL